MLSTYIGEVQNLLNDQQGQFHSIPTLQNYVNRSRRRIAYVSGCLRVLPPGTRTHRLQEVYRFSDWKPLVQAVHPGIQSILAVRTLAVAIGPGGWKPVWRRTVFSDFQARFRIYNGTYYGTVSEPGWYCQYGEGELGVLYLAPIPSQSNPLDVDCTCIPSDLLTDNDPELIPQPWADAVPWWAATLALIQQQRGDDAKQMAALFNTEMPLAASVVCPQLLVNPYGATLRSA